MTDIDTVAEAIWRSYRLSPVESLALAHPDDRRTFHRLAQAAIDALQLIEETRLDPAGWSFPESGVQSRLVSPWVRVEEQP